MPNGNWIETLHQMICRLYREWGGDCNALPPAMSDQIKSLWDEYNLHGAPSVPTQDLKAAYLALLGDVDEHLDLPENSLNVADDASLRLLTDTLAADLGETPD